MILDGGATTVGVESTVVQVLDGKTRILRVGGISREQIERVVGEVSVLNHDRAEEQGLPSPGLLKKHYSPYAEMIYITGEESRERLLRVATNEVGHDCEKVGIMLTDGAELPALPSKIKVIDLGSSADLADVARNIYAALRALDSWGAKVIYCHDFPETGLGAAIRDRLHRAATRII